MQMVKEVLYMKITEGEIDSWNNVALIIYSKNVPVYMANILYSWGKLS